MEDLQCAPIIEYYFRLAALSREPMKNRSELIQASVGDRRGQESDFQSPIPEFAAQLEEAFAPWNQVLAKFVSDISTLRANGSKYPLDDTQY